MDVEIISCRSSPLRAGQRESDARCARRDRAGGRAAGFTSTCARLPRPASEAHRETAQDLDVADAARRVDRHLELDRALDAARAAGPGRPARRASRRSRARSARRRLGSGRRADARACGTGSVPRPSESERRLLLGGGSARGSTTVRFFSGADLLGASAGCLRVGRHDVDRGGVHERDAPAPCPGTRSSRGHGVISITVPRVSRPARAAADTARA
jgi:hypothetical protein